MHDRPTPAELMDAVRLFLEKELLPNVTDARLRFQGLVAANVLAVACRELASEEAHLLEEREALRAWVSDLVEVPPGVAGLRAAVRQLNERLCQAIRAGEMDERMREVCEVLRRLTLRKLEVANPRYSGIGSRSEAPGGSPGG